MSKICFEQKGYSFDLIQYATLNNAIKSINLGVIVPLPVPNWFSKHNFDNRDVPFFLQSKPCLLILAVRNNDSVGIGWPAPSDQLYCCQSQQETSLGFWQNTDMHIQASTFIIKCWHNMHRAVKAAIIMSLPSSCTENIGYFK